MSISVLLLTLNEADNLPACLAAVDWSDDVVVLDSFSQDETVAVAEGRGARVYQRAFDDFAGQRNYALDHFPFKHEWVLHLDADEIVTPALRAEMESAVMGAVEASGAVAAGAEARAEAGSAVAETSEAVALAPAEGRYDAWRLPSKMMFMGRWLRYSGLYPSYQVRLGHRDRFRFKQVGHGQREDLAPARIGTLREPYLHYSFSKGLTDWVDKHNRYASAEAREAMRLLGAGGGLDWAGLWAREPSRRRRALKALSSHLPLRPLLRFLYMYVLRRGFLDGRAGLTYCRLLAIYEYLIVLKTRELLSGTGQVADRD